MFACTYTSGHITLSHMHTYVIVINPQSYHMTIYRILYIYTHSECSSIHSAQAHSNSMAAGCLVTLSPPLRDFAPFSSRVLLCNSLVFDVLVEGIAERFPLGVAVVLRLEHLASKDYRHYGITRSTRCFGLDYLCLWSTSIVTVIVTFNLDDLQLFFHLSLRLCVTLRQ